MIEMHQAIVLNSRTSRGSLWHAECRIGGINFEAASRHGAPHALARVLKAAGIADQPVTVMADGLSGKVTYPSLDRMAAYTIAESAAVPVKTAPWVPLEIADPAEDVSSKTGGEADPATDERTPISTRISHSRISTRKQVRTRTRIKRRLMPRTAA